MRNPDAYGVKGAQCAIHQNPVDQIAVNGGYAQKDMHLGPH